jgi:methionyl-tRNA formyltransferase
MIVITGAKFAPRLLDIVGKHKDIFVSRGENVQIVRQLDELSRLEISDGQCLICFNTEIIVPKSLLAKVGRESYNFHAAPPEFPGRDPHHWAINRSATQYGATCHVMTEKVDDGPIIAVAPFEIQPGTTPENLAAQATDVAAGLFEKLLPRLLVGDMPVGDFEWGPIKTTREDSLRMRGLKGFEDF